MIPTAKFDNVPTAQEFYKKYWSLSQPNMAIEFAKLHVIAALEAAYKSTAVRGYVKRIDRHSILNAYPLTNIQ